MVLKALVMAAVVLYGADSGEPGSRDLETLLVLNKLDSTVSFLDPATGEEVAVVEVGDSPHEVAVSPDGRTAVVCNYGARRPGQTLSVLDVKERRVVRTIDLQEHRRPHGIVYMPDGERVLVTAEANRALLVVNVGTGEVERAIGTDQDISHMVALTPDGKHAYVANIRSGSVSIIDVERGRLERIVETGAGAEGVAAHPTRSEVWVSNRAADTLSIIDTRTMEVVETLECGSFPIRVTISPDGMHALVSNARSGEVAVFDVARRREVARVAMEMPAVEEGEREGRLFQRTFGSSPVPIGLLVRPDRRYAYVANTNADVVTAIDMSDWSIAGHMKCGREPDGLGWSVIRAQEKEPE